MLFYQRRDLRRRCSLQYEKLGHGSRPDGQIQAGRGSWHMGLERVRASGGQEQGSSSPTPRNGTIPLQREVITHTHTREGRAGGRVMPAYQDQALWLRPWPHLAGHDGRSHSTQRDENGTKQCCMHSWSLQTHHPVAPVSAVNSPRTCLLPTKKIVSTR